VKFFVGALYTLVPNADGERHFSRAGI
jgi:hypothetical protein